jgi:hypothetical protein
MEAKYVPFRKRDAQMTDFLNLIAGEWGES